jgi:uncharacterized membrane protein
VSHTSLTERETSSIRPSVSAQPLLWSWVSSARTTRTHRVWLGRCLPCRAVTPGGELAGQAQQLFQVGEQLASHLNAVREQAAEQLG